MMTTLRVLAIGGYLGAIPVVLAWEHGRQAFWTCAIASLPLLWVAIGFHAWRRVCPLAAFARLGAWLGREGKARVSSRVARAAPLIQLGLMLVALSLRHAATNGDRVALAAFLALLAAAAALVGLRWSGRTWCNVVCPVGLVERLYTEAAGSRGTSSRCAPCTGCVRACPDVDLERSHRAALSDWQRRLAGFAWPGVVLGFYLVWRLESGGWEAYFSGAWAHAEGWRVSAAPLVLLGCGAVSAAALAPLEVLLDRRRAQVVAGALAFATFYVFAGQPTVRLLPVPLWTLMGLLCGWGALGILIGGRRPQGRARPLPVVATSL